MEVGFGGLLLLTLVGAFLYLSGAAGIARHDALYAALLATFWGAYLIQIPLLRTRILGSLLRAAGKLLLPAGVVAFFGVIYWLILSHA
jgi:hypothetical protein